MELGSLVRDAAAGFAIGFASGYQRLRISRKAHSEYDLKQLDASLDDECLDKSGLKRDTLNGLINTYSKMRALVPYVASWAYVNVASALTQTPFIEAAVAIPSAYVGAVAGYFARKAKDSKILKEIESCRTIREHPERALEFLPREKAERIRDALSRIEEDILEGKSEEPINTEQLEVIYNTIAEQRTRYTPALLNWSIREQTKIINRANAQRELKRFFGTPAPLFCGGLGKVELGRKGVLYELAGENCRVYDIDFSGLTFISKDEADGGKRELVTKMGSTTLNRESKWDGNYRGLAEQVIADTGKKNIFLLKTPEGMPELVRNMMVTNTALSYLHDSDSEKDENSEEKN